MVYLVFHVGGHRLILLLRCFVFKSFFFPFFFSIKPEVPETRKAKNLCVKAVWVLCCCVVLLFSFYIEPQRNRDDWGWIPLIAGYSVAKTLHAFHATVKWPNDIVINNKKVSGLIAEVVGKGVVIGIGINVGMDENQLPVETATSLLIEGGVDLTRDEILCEVLEEFEEHFVQWDQGIDEVQPLYRHLSATLGKEVRVEYPGGATHLATAVSISDTGALVLDDGTHVQSADVIHLR